MAFRLTVLASGSRGNASLLRVGGFSVLLDIGLGPRDLGDRLKAIGTGWPQIGAVLLTHTHSDHWNERTLAYLRGLHIPLYCHGEHQTVLLHYGEAFAGLRAENLVHTYEAGLDFEPVAGLCCRAVAVRHDSGATFGFRLETTAGLFNEPLALGYLSDLGCWTPELAEAMADVDLLALEFNHDVGMQHASGRSPHLIRRVLGEEGHLSNDQAAAFVGEVLRRSTPGRLQHVVQLHLSQDCNRPALAQQAAQDEIGNQAIQVHTAHQDRPTATVWLGPGSPAPRAVVKAGRRR